MQLPCRRVRRPRRVGLDTGRRPLVRRRWRRGYDVSRPYGPGCLPGHRDYLTRHDSPGFDAGRLLRPLVPRERSRSLARPPPAVSDGHAARHRAHGASVPYAGASPAAAPPYSRTAQLRFGTWASPSTSYVRRARTGFPPAVWSPSLSGWLPTTPPQGGSHMAATIAPAPKRHQRKIVSTLAATAQKADLAPRHYRNPACSAGMPHRECDVPRRGRPAVTGRCASDLPSDKHRHGAHHRLVGAGPLQPRPHPVAGAHGASVAPSVTTSRGPRTPRCAPARSCRSPCVSP